MGLATQTIPDITVQLNSEFENGNLISEVNSTYSDAFVTMS